MNKYLILGDGLLGSEIHKQAGWDCASRKTHQIDIRDFSTYMDFLGKYDGIINCIANTDTYSNDKKSIMETNYKSVITLAEACSLYDVKLIHISTDYVYANSNIKPTRETDVPSPCSTWYSISKLLADMVIENVDNLDYLIIRTSFKPMPFPYPNAYTNVVGNFDYVDKIAELIIRLIEKNPKGIYNVGTDKKSMYELAKQTNNEVLQTVVGVGQLMPKDISMNLYKMNNILGTKYKD